MITLSATSPSAHLRDEFLKYPIPPGPITEMSCSPYSTFFSLWSPNAESVRVIVYPTGEGGLEDAHYDLTKSANGKWTIYIRKCLLGKFYTFQVKYHGRWLEETPGIFCKATGVNGQRAAIIDMEKTCPEGWGSDTRPELKDYSDIIIYEMHHRDFSMDAQSGIINKGKFLALTEHGTKNTQGLSTGIDHLKELGITHVHILPSNDFGSIDEKFPEHSYNWGYDPVNYNVPEGSYSTDAYDPYVRIREFKQMVLALHKAGIRIVLDVVYNHVYDAAKSQFERTVPGYFFRYKEDGSYSNASGCGNETASDMPMMRKYMVESVMYWIKEYHLDGFRFDLMGIHDIETMNSIREAVNSIDPSIFIYGEGWSASSPQFPYSQLAMKSNMVNMKGIAAFGDEFRDALRGGLQDDREGAFLVGNTGHEESLKFGIVGAVMHPQIDYTKINYSSSPWAEEPTQMISYVSCHDDLCLADRIKTTLCAKRSTKMDSCTCPDSHSMDERVRLQKLAETAVLVSQGIPFLWCGDEILRDKKGVRNSYNSPDSVNAISWTNKTKYNDLFSYIVHLINIRKAHKAFHMGSASLVRKHLEFLSAPKKVIAFKLDGSAVGDTWNTIIIVLNSKTIPVKIQIPQDNYTIVCLNGKVDPRGLSKCSGMYVYVPAQSALIMHN